MLHFCFRLEPGDFPTNLSQGGPGTNTLVHLDLLNASSKDKCILPAEQGIQHQFQLPMWGSDCPALPPQWKNGRIKHCKCVKISKRSLSYPLWHSLPFPQHVLCGGVHSPSNGRNSIGTNFMLASIVQRISRQVVPTSSPHRMPFTEKYIDRFRKRKQPHTLEKHEAVAKLQIQYTYLISISHIHYYTCR